MGMGGLHYLNRLLPIGLEGQRIQKRKKKKAPQISMTIKSNIAGEFIMGDA
jgi:hypothetical protein